MSVECQVVQIQFEEHFIKGFLSINTVRSVQYVSLQLQKNSKKQLGKTQLHNLEFIYW